MPDEGIVIIVNTSQRIDGRVLLGKFGNAANLDEANQTIGEIASQFGTCEGLLLTVLTEQEKQEMEAEWEESGG